MMKKYCQKCGNRMEYKVAQKPKFCPQCGVSFMASANAHAIETPQPQLNKEMEELDVESFDSESLNELDVEMSPFSPLKGEKLGNIIGTSMGEKSKMTGIPP